MLPKVSIITPCFNGAGTISDCINSVKKQNYANIEHIIIDGGSTDGTLKILEESGVQYISGPDAGIYDAINKGIQESTGEILGILNCDDYYPSPDVISTVIEQFTCHDIDLLHGKIEQIDDNGRKVWTVGSDVTTPQLMRKMKVAHPSVFVRREVYEKLGGFSIGFRIAGDYDFVLRAFPRTRTQFIDKVMVKMRMNGVSQTHSIKSMRESMAVQLVHGTPPLKALANYYESLIKHKASKIARSLGIRR